MQHSRKASIIISLILLFSIAASMLLVPNTSAHNTATDKTQWNLPTFAFVQVVPNPIGVGQTATVYMWLSNTYDSELITNNYRFRNYELTITAPNGTTQSVTIPYVSDTTSNVFYSWTPTQTGTYSFLFTYPGQTISNDTTSPGNPSSTYQGDYYLPSNSTCTATVQQDQIANLPQTPLPTQYWTRPIYGQNVYWYTIASNWLGTGSAGYGTGAAGCNYPPGEAVGPQTSHIMWTYPIDMGGVVGSNSYPIAGVSNFEGSAYNARFTNPIIINGYLYYTMPVSFGGGTTGQTVCQDLRTGKIKWTSTQIPALSFGYVYDLEDPDQHGVYPPILFTSSFARAFDAYTGLPLFNVTGVPTGTAMVGPSGEQLKLILTNNGNATNPGMYLNEWNSSRLWETWTNPWTGGVITSPTLYNDSTSSGASLTATQAMYASTTQPTITVPAGLDPNQPATYNYVVYGNVVNSSSSLYTYDWNYSLSWLNTVTPVPSIVAAWAGDRALLRSGSYQSPTSTQPAYTYYMVNLNTSNGAVGTMLWSKTLQQPAGNLTVSYSGPANSDPTSGVFVEFHKETMQFVGYSMADGHQIWGPVGNQSQQQLMYYNSGYNSGGNENGAAYAYGRLYYDGFGGVMSCYDLQTGNLLWTYGNGGSGNTTNSGFEVPGPYPMSIMAIGNGVVYTTTTEHTVEIPIYKGATQQAINATDGTLIWSLNEVTSEAGSPVAALETGAIADGFSVSLNGYDNQIYCVGRGPSSTTVSAPDIAASLGTPIVIRGTVMDISAGTKQDQQSSDFPHGVPCASDASESEWMSYIYEQQPEPSNFIGVQVQLNVLDSNGNYRPIGVATTNTNGMYTISWTPDIAGNYTVYANFGGTNAYWPSTDTTSFTVMSPAMQTATPTGQPVNDTTTQMYVLGIGVAIIIVVIIVGAVLALLSLRKRA